MLQEPDEIKLAVLCDLPEEGWPSMDLAGVLIAGALEAVAPENLSVKLIRPNLRRRFTRADESQGRRFNLDRSLNRHGDYPAALDRLRPYFTHFHIVDHSYAQLVLRLPRERTIVTCHDLDTFSCLLGEDTTPRSWIFRRLAMRTLNGLQAAARVICVSQATANEVFRHGLVAEERLRVVHNPVHPVFFQPITPETEAAAAQLLGPVVAGAIDLLHVGSNIARKRIDVLLHIFAGIRREWPQARLLRVGGALSAEQQQLAEQLEVAEAVVTLPHLTREVLAAVYARATLTLMTSEREGFGWPVAESLAAGVPVSASDIPVLREVGGAATEYTKVADIGAWVKLVSGLLRENANRPQVWALRKQRARDRAARFSMESYGKILLEIYREMIKF